MVGAPQGADSARKIVAIGLNYLDHIRGANLERPTRLLVFSKFPSSVIGREARHVREEDALDHGAAYTIGNDVAARDVRFTDGQWVRGKSFDTFCPLRPWLVSADAVADPEALRLSTRVNGELVQNATTGERGRLGASD